MSLFILTTAIAQAHFTLVSPIAIEQTQAINLGIISNQISVNCQLDQFSRQGSGCISSDNQLGQFAISGHEQALINVVVYPSDNANIAFTPILPNGTQQQSFSLSDSTTVIEVGGKVDVIDDKLTGLQQVSYTIEVNYQ
ncbi:MULTISPECIES: hypothetical protein [Shewanella]|uniref:hypothetical protein n=1 Tax=Shewanella TaxID=22 RepID=UPI001BB89481|nr:MULTISPECIES: hypothetical protein [Shewanella]GIU47729.1 hypothetical protein TUM4249_01240 [Shewanella sp. KT0246]